MDGFCRAESLEVSEPIGGTAASHTDVWLALEHDHAWGAKAVRDSGLAGAVAEHLAALEAQIEGARVQLIRRERIAPASTFIVAVTALGQQHALRMAPPSHEALLSLDVPAIVAELRAGRWPAVGHRIDAPIVLVCTNGKRDRCCAKWGLPLYRALASRGDLECWQTTHIGGHRFAPTLVTLPEGLCYGRLHLDDVAPLADAIVAGKVYEPLRTLRGRTCLSPAAQLAEVHWRHGSGQLRADALVSTTTSETTTDTEVAVVDDTGAQHRFAIRRASLGATAHPSCAKDPKEVFGLFATPLPAAAPAE